MDVPPQTTFIFRPRTSPYGWSASATCMASSRVGVRMTPRGRRLSVWPPDSWVSSGRPKDSVLPEPVRPRPRMSRPDRASGMVAAWIGKGVTTPFWFSLRTMASGRPRSAKVMVGSAGSVVSTVVSTVGSTAVSTVAASAAFSGMAERSALSMDMLKLNLSETYGTRQLHRLLTTASMRSAKEKRNAPRGAQRIRRQAMGSGNQGIKRSTSIRISGRFSESPPWGRPYLLVPAHYTPYGAVVG
ncbi:hypothetical protein SCOCK_490065 [Actinacidiphila cocklensis]|uniref:Uncharacterized protein n=1 Tax=Actinacidiphila cocklensis TaxID=887465 RepID=A0A9W4GVQ3_9ACTN|nr:hypothetical protein SCOCK_490065 [Actinacidiphila cocklensis]